MDLISLCIIVCFGFSELLSRFELWTKSNEVISLSHLPQVHQLNQQSTVIRTECPTCSKVLERAGWWCHKCRTVVNLCSIWSVSSLSLSLCVPL